jgi:hypothetical protein
MDCGEVYEIIKYLLFIFGKLMCEKILKGDK